jgi:hypothetical protein
MSISATTSAPPVGAPSPMRHEQPPEPPVSGALPPAPG